MNVYVYICIYVYIYVTYHEDTHQTKQVVSYGYTAHSNKVNVSKITTPLSLPHKITIDLTFEKFDQVHTQGVNISPVEISQKAALY